jgi:hypothetical protein
MVMAGFDGIVRIDLDFVVFLRASSRNKRDNAKNGECSKNKEKIESNKSNRTPGRMSFAYRIRLIDEQKRAKQVRD